MKPKTRKKEIEPDQPTDVVFTALAHPSRRQILLDLRSHNGKMTAGEIARRFSCTWPTITKHLHVLSSASLIRVEKSGRERVYYLETDHLMRVTRKWLRWFEDGL